MIPQILEVLIGVLLFYFFQDHIFEIFFCKYSIYPHTSTTFHILPFSLHSFFTNFSLISLDFKNILLNNLYPLFGIKECTITFSIKLFFEMLEGHFLYFLFGQCVLLGPFSVFFYNLITKFDSVFFIDIELIMI